MSTQRSEGSWSRRRFFGALAACGGSLLVAACGQQSGASPPAAKAPSTPATVAKPAAPAAAAQPTAAPTPAAAAPAKPAAEPKTSPGVFNVWFSANWNTVTDEAIGTAFIEWGKQNGGQKVEWQSIPGSPQQLAKESAALAAGQPPEVNNANRIYWYSQGEMADLKDLVSKFKDKAGGMYDIATSSETAGDGAIIGAPYAIDVWPTQWRTDEIGKANDGKPFSTWDQLIEMGPKIQKPPRTYTIAFCLGHEGDHVNNVVTALWSYGGRLNDEKGVPDIKNPANKAGFEMIKRMWDAKLIPTESFAQTVTSWNNETYQKSRALMAINPATIMGWLLVNDKDLAEQTGIAPNPGGSAGSFAEGAAISFNYFKKAPLASKAPSALEFFMQPDNLLKISKSVEGRFVPVYRDHAKGDFWEKSKFSEMRKVAENGRIRNWPAAPQPWLTDIASSNYVLSDMLSKILNDGMSIEDAQGWAHGVMMGIYEDSQKKA
jgi:ABC-type glycerol-3-phosphate transport system substrate-binding protein